ncbi:MAG: hypothetical protein KQH53_18140 [Desulfarculaceae bacterium]|nr:hypothetical protein [Desulfarculaceae bacterium]
MKLAKLFLFALVVAVTLLPSFVLAETKGVKILAVNASRADSKMALGTLVKDGYSGLLVHEGPNGWVEWKVNLQGGQYYINVNFAAGSSRPLKLKINGIDQGRILSESTGGWKSNSLKWVKNGPYTFKQGLNVIRMESTGLFPHLKMLSFTRMAQHRAVVKILAINASRADSKMALGTLVKDGYSGLLVHEGPNGWVEWKINLQGGQYYINVNFAAGSSRPLKLIINGVDQGRILSESTGGWKSDSLKWVKYGPYAFKRGLNVIRMESKGLFPHLKMLSFSPK